MVSRLATIMLCSLALALGSGCGDDTSDGDGAGGGSSGSGGSGGSSGSGSTNVTPEAALAGACDMMGSSGGEQTDCTGVDEYSKCAQEDCGVQDCMDGPCADLLTCATEAADACNNDCMPSTECNECLAGTATCAFDMCFDLLSCGETVAGGACDKLGPCCAAQMEGLKEVCEMQVSAAKAGGDEACEALVMAYMCN